METCKTSGNVDPLFVISIRDISRLYATLYRESLNMLVTKGFSFLANLVISGSVNQIMNTI